MMESEGGASIIDVRLETENAKRATEILQVKHPSQALVSEDRSFRGFEPVTVNTLAKAERTLV